jgi:hypothetical protein
VFDFFFFRDLGTILLSPFYLFLTWKFRGFFEHYFFFLFIRNARSKNRHWRPCFFGVMSLFTRSPVVKVPQWKKCLGVCVPYSKFDFFPPVTLCLPFVRPFLLSFSVTGGQPSRCFAARTSVVFLAKTKTQLSEGKFKFVVCWEHKHKRFFRQATFISMVFGFKFLIHFVFWLFMYTVSTACFFGSWVFSLGGQFYQIDGLF